jgi:polyribonucleotide nucleotidyltransferase
MDKQLLDGAMYKGESDFLLHYNFPPFSTGEARPIRGVSRREIGHGNLALRALRGMLPEKEECPYTIRIVSDILESNGSSSMATVCAGTLALLDAGVPIKKSVSGIAMGLIADDQGKYAVLSDILGDEDHLGDMDFKVTGTADGITACQMDIKVDGLSYEILEEALMQAREGRLHILGEMNKTMSAVREDYKEHVPRMESFTVPNDCIGAIIGPGGKVIQDIQKRTETIITIEELEDGQGMVQISSADAEKMRAAVTEIKNIAFPPQAEVGEVYEGKVKSIMPYGAFVEVVPGTDGLLHISEIEWGRLEKVEDALKEGQVVKFKVLSKDPKTKKLKLSRKVLLPKPEPAGKAD